MPDASMTCRRCGEEKPAISEFFRPQSRICRVCKNAESAEWHRANPGYNASWKRKNAALVHERNIASYAAHPERYRASSKKYYWAHRDELVAQMAEKRAAEGDQEKAARRAYCAAHREGFRRAAKRYAAAHPDARNATEAVRRARKANAPVVERVDRNAIWARDKGRCHVCRKKCDPKSWHLDHLVPLACGGEHSARNVAVSHPACNLSRGTRGVAQPLLVSVEMAKAGITP